jgi:nicotinamide-nucleotide amidase
MNAEIVSVGTELLLGEIVDTNAVYLAGQLPALGIDLYWVSQVGDNQSRLVEVLGRALSRSDITLISGGLGPTADDLTREAIAQLMGEVIYQDAVLATELATFFAARGITMSASNLKQATLIPSARALPNARGTAPGWWVEKGKHIIVAMPGPPEEMKHVWQTAVLPCLRHCAQAVLCSRTIKLFGISESLAGEMMTPYFESPNPTLGIYAKPDGIQLRFAAKAADEAAAHQLLDPCESIVRALFRDKVWGIDDETLDSVLLNLLAQRQITLATMEFGTQGWLAATLAAGSNTDRYRGGLVAATIETLSEFGLERALIEGEDIEKLAAAMARRACLILGADCGLSIVESPTVVSTSKYATALYIGIDGPGICKTVRVTYSGGKERIKRLTTSAAFFEIIQALRCTA